MNKTTIVLPKWLEPIANRYATDYVEESLGINKGGTGYAKNFKKAKFVFCKDYHEANTGIKAANPTTSKAGSAFDQFKPILFEGPQSFIGGNARNSDHAKMAARRLKADIIHLAHIYLEFGSKMDLKRTDQTLSDFEYRKRTGKAAIDKSEKIKVDKHRFKRTFVVTALLSAIESVYKLPDGDLNVLIDMAMNKIPEKKLNNASVHYEFSKVLIDHFRNAYKNVDIVRAGRDALISDWEK